MTKKQKYTSFRNTHFLTIVGPTGIVIQKHHNCTILRLFLCRIISYITMIKRKTSKACALWWDVAEKQTITNNIAQSQLVAVPPKQLRALIREKRFKDSILLDLASIVLEWTHKSFIQHLTSGKFRGQNHCVCDFKSLMWGYERIK